ncbi:hypothetical protein [Streptomyces sp. NBC_00354]|uniref:hypothetical protein n=1 Tax=Streptomyces sp. NBC_00354 TaxID=2975723 RepID=UPI002E2536F1|nr:hypothetical protein OG296_20520 [Streptomyces sp. NBC_01001]
MVAGRRIRFTAVLVAVVFALTGFSSGGHGGKSKSKGSGSGGGCSSSKKKSSYNSNNNSNGGGKSTPSPTKSAGPPAHAQVVSCAGPGSPKAVLRVTSDVDKQRTVDVPLTFEGANGVVDRTSVRVTLKARETQTVTAPMVHDDKAADVKTCAVGRID